jgi:Short C-terminal domain
VLIDQIRIPVDVVEAVLALN